MREALSPRAEGLFSTRGSAQVAPLPLKPDDNIGSRAADDTPPQPAGRTWNGVTASDITARWVPSG